MLSLCALAIIIGAFNKTDLHSSLFFTPLLLISFPRPHSKVAYGFMLATKLALAATGGGVGSQGQCTPGRAASCGICTNERAGKGSGDHSQVHGVLK